MWKVSTTWQLIHLGNNNFINPFEVVGVTPNLSIPDTSCHIILQHQILTVHLSVETVMEAITKWSEKKTS